VVRESKGARKRLTGVGQERMDDMKKRTIILIACILTFTLIIGGSIALARDGSARIDIMYRNIKLVVNGVPVAVSADNEPFIYGGRTYVPLRVVSEALGYDVSWDANTSSVIIGDSGTPAPTPAPTPPATSQNLIDILPPYHITNPGGSGSNYFPTTGMESFQMGGIQYKNSLRIVAAAHAQSASFNLAGKYTSLTGIIGTLDNQNRDAMVNVYADGNIIKTIEITGGALPKGFELDVTGVRELKIEHIGNNGGNIGLAELIIK